MTPGNKQLLTNLVTLSAASVKCNLIIKFSANPGPATSLNVKPSGLVHARFISLFNGGTRESFATVRIVVHFYSRDSVLPGSVSGQIPRGPAAPQGGTPGPNGRSLSYARDYEGRSARVPQN